MEINNEQANKLVDILRQNGYNDLAGELQQSIDNKMVQIGKLYEMSLCHHQWIYSDRPGKQGNLSVYLDKLWASSLAEEEKQERAAVAKYFAHCSKCGLRYEDKNLDLKQVSSMLDEEYKVRISISGSHYAEFISIQRQQEEFRTKQTQERLQSLKDDIQWLQGNVSKLSDKEAKDQFKKIAKEIATLEENEQES